MTAKLGNTVLLDKPIEEKELALHLAQFFAERPVTDDPHARTRPALEGAPPQLA